VSVKKYRLPRSAVAGLRVGDLLRNEDREAHVFGRIVKLLGSDEDPWVMVHVDPEDRG
jgi:hypothetical protein